MLHRGVREIGLNETKVLLDTNLAPHLTVKERSTTTRARVTEVKDDLIKTMRAYERLRQICDYAQQCSVQLSEVLNTWVLPCLMSP
jgi:ABC-type arginine transport system ATPase subunit